MQCSRFTGGSGKARKIAFPEFCFRGKRVYVHRANFTLVGKVLVLGGRQGKEGCAGARKILP